MRHGFRFSVPTVRSSIPPTTRQVLGSTGSARQHRPTPLVSPQLLVLAPVSDLQKTSNAIFPTETASNFAFFYKNPNQALERTQHTLACASAPKLQKVRPTLSDLLCVKHSHASGKLSVKMKTGSRSCHSLSAQGADETKALPLDIQWTFRASKSYGVRRSSQRCFLNTLERRAVYVG